MSKLRRLLPAVLLLFIVGCSSGSEETYREGSVEELYNEAVDYLVDRSFRNAAETFTEVERQHPYSVWATKAQLMAAYAYYQNNSYDDAILALDRFIQLHPSNPDVGYAYYLKALSYYEQIVDVGRDQEPTMNALNALEEVVRRFPDSDYARDARLKLDLARDHLAGKEMEIGRFYLKRRSLLAAVNRFRVVVDRYQTTSHVPEALHRLVEAYTAMGLDHEARRMAAILGYNYADSVWYRDTYAIVGDVDVSIAALPGDDDDERGFFSRTWNWAFSEPYRIGNVNMSASARARAEEEEQLAQARELAPDGVSRVVVIEPRSPTATTDTAATAATAGGEDQARLIAELRALRGNGGDAAPAPSDALPSDAATATPSASAAPMTPSFARPMGTVDEAPPPPTGEVTPADRPETARPAPEFPTPLSPAEPREPQAEPTQPSFGVERPTAPAEPEPAPTETRPGPRSFDPVGPRTPGDDAVSRRLSELDAERQRDAEAVEAARQRISGQQEERSRQVTEAQQQRTSAQEALEAWSEAHDAAQTTEGRMRAASNRDAAQAAVRYWDARQAVAEAITPDELRTAQRELAVRSLDYWQAVERAADDAGTREHAAQNRRAAEEAVAYWEANGAAPPAASSGGASAGGEPGWLGRTVRSIF